MKHLSVRERVGRYWPRSKHELKAFAAVRRYGTADTSAAVRAVVADLIPRRFHGQRAVAHSVILLVALARPASGYHAEIGRTYLVRDSGADPKTVTAAIRRLGRAGLIYTPVHGRKGIGNSIYAASAELIGRVAERVAALGRGRQAAGRELLARKRSRSQGGMSGANNSPSKSSVRRSGDPAPAPGLLDVTDDRLCPDSGEPARRCPFCRRGKGHPQ